MTTTASTLMRELDHRSSNGIDVRLMWSRAMAGFTWPSRTTRPARPSPWRSARARARPRSSSTPSRTPIVALPRRPTASRPSRLAGRADWAPPLRGRSRPWTRARASMRSSGTSSTRCSSSPRARATSAGLSGGLRDADQHRSPALRGVPLAPQPHLSPRPRRRHARRALRPRRRAGTGRAVRRRAGDEGDKFARCEWHDGHEGVPILDACANWFVGRVLHRIAAGDHDLFLLEPVAAGAGDQDEFSFHRAKRIEPGHEA